MRLTPNSPTGLIWGLTNFDAVEFDIRITSDENLVIYHDPTLPNGTLVENMDTRQLQKLNIPLLVPFFNDQTVRDLVHKKKSLWVEIKPNCRGSKRIDTKIAEQVMNSFLKIVDETSIKEDAIKIMSFSEKLIHPFSTQSKFPTYIIKPDVNECDQRFVKLKALPQIILKSLKTRMLDAKQMEISGVLVARQFLMGLGSKRHPNYLELQDISKELGIELGTNVGPHTKEDQFSFFHRFTDDMSSFPRISKKGEGQIIAHRGTGVKGVDI